MVKAMTYYKTVRPYEMIDRENAESLAEFNLQMGIWDSYLIPELLPKGKKVLYKQ